jgi:hypothetical protein
MAATDQELIETMKLLEESRQERLQMERRLAAEDDGPEVRLSIERRLQQGEIT